MAAYKVLQDIEAEDKLLGPLTLKQFIFAGIAVVCLYLSFFAATKHASLLLVFLLPPAFVSGFLAWPWSRDQPTEIWLLAKIRFFLKPRRRIWDQDGIQELVTITVPKKLEQHLVNDLSQTEVKSRLKALASTIDSRGWAIKNINVNLSAQPAYVTPDPTSDRLIDLATLPQEVSDIDVGASDDIMDEQNNPVAQQLETMIGASTKEHRQQLMKHVQELRDHPQADASQPADQPAPVASQDLWFMQPAASQPPAGYAVFNPQVVPPGSDPAATLPAPVVMPEEKALLAKLHADEGKPSAAYGHMKVINPLGQKSSPKAGPPALQTPVTPPPDPAILDLANNDDLNVATIARQAQKAKGQEPPDEVVIPLR